jgi:hypothetical protein
VHASVIFGRLPSFFGHRVVLRYLTIFDDAAGPDGAAALADREAEALLHRDRRDQLDLHLDVVAGHDHLDAVRAGSPCPVTSGRSGSRTAAGSR